MFVPHLLNMGHQHMGRQLPRILTARPLYTPALLSHIAESLRSRITL